MIKVSIIGATGYAGEELIKILVRHPKVKISHLAAKIEESCPINKIFPWLTNILDVECSNEIDVKKIAGLSDVVFLALPHRVSMEVVPGLIKEGKKVIDLSADYRLKSTNEYEKWYETPHKNKELLQESVYGLCELYREKIKKARLIANPGCYPTGSILACAPFLKAKIVEPDIIVDAKSGTTGAGRTLAVKLLFSEVDENFRAYKVCNHQHMPEITQELQNLSGDKISLTFVPHLVPMNRGILSTVYFNLKKNISVFDAVDTCKQFYKNEPFVRIKDADVFPEIRDVVNFNFCDIGVKVVEKRLIVISAIDNLIKGAAGQAVQNLNIMFDLDETTGLIR